MTFLVIKRRYIFTNVWRFSPSRILGYERGFFCNSLLNIWSYLDPTFKFRSFCPDNSNRHFKSALRVDVQSAAVIKKTIRIKYIFCPLRSVTL